MAELVKLILLVIFTQQHANNKTSTWRVTLSQPHLTYMHFHLFSILWIFILMTRFHSFLKLNVMVLWRVWWYMPLIRRVIVRIIGFISSSLHTPDYTYIQQYSTIADIHTFQHTVAHALRFSDSTSCLLITALSTQTITVSHSKYYT
jgi:hypothetical protein